MSDRPPFSELLERVQAGDKDARTQLFDALACDEGEGRTILAMARKVLPAGDPARDFVESRDLIQTALRAGWLDMSRFAGERPAQFFAWLRTILRHKLSHKVRKRQARIGHGVPAEADATRPSDAEPQPIEAALRQETLDRLRAEIDELPPDMRIVVQRRLSGQNAPQIAEELGISPAAVRKRESRAMQRLREMLEADAAD